MTTDARALSELLEESQDLQADALHGTTEALADFADAARGAQADPETNAAFADAHRRNVHASLAATTVLGAAGGGLLVGLLASPAFASASPDVQMLQTAASIEVLAVSTYTTALTLPYIGGSSANPVVKAFATTTMGQHAQHRDAFNAALKAMGAAQQTNPDPAFVPVVQHAVASLSGASASAGALGVVGLALELENVAAETYISDVPKLHSSSNKALFASIMGVEAQHVAVLRAVQALLQAGAAQLITLSPTNVAYLPAVAGKVGFPNAFYPTNQAAPARQGAVK
jgi:hypothetical protein